MTQNRSKITRSSRAVIGRKKQLGDEAKMADPPDDGWQSLLSETIPELGTNFNDDRAMNDPMIGDFDGKFINLFISLPSVRITR